MFTKQIDTPSPNQYSNLNSIKECILWKVPEAKDEYLKIMASATVKVIAGTYKLQPGSKNDEEILRVLRFLSEKNVKVKVLSESRLTEQEIQESTNLPVNIGLQAMKDTGAVVITNLEKFVNVHAKFVNVDDKILIMGNTNNDKDSTDKISRDFNYVFTDVKIIQQWCEIEEALISGKEIECSKHDFEVNFLNNQETKLSISAYHKKHIVDMIRSAQYEILIYQQSLQDLSVVDELRKKQSEGVPVQILASKFPFGSKHGNINEIGMKKLIEVGVQVRLTGEKIVDQNLPLHIHGKVLICDDTMYLGSANFWDKVLDFHNDKEKDMFNIGAITKRTDFITTVKDAFREDWNKHEGCEFKSTNIARQEIM